ncbi:MAG: cation diffusion facilitator family transporter [Deltaproteobacteria bacterium]|nr:MAG: cation diffusion facilitator family transporter [Deltaproteobacteria bacterium]
MAEDSKRAVVAALLGNVALALLKGVAAAATGSAAMFAETLHSIADSGNEVLLFLGMRLARRPPDDRHPLGHGRDVYFWAFVVSGLLFSLGGGFAIWEAVRTFLYPEPHESYFWGYVVLAGAFVFESGSLVVGGRAFARAKARRSFSEYLRDLRDPTVLVVVLEDSAALVSIVIAAAGLALSQWTNSELYDALASGLIGVILIAVAGFLAYDTYSLLLGEAATPTTMARICDAVAAERDAVAVTSVRTLHIGPESLFIALRIHFRDDLRTRDIEAAVARLKDGIATMLPDMTRPQLIVIEPTSAGSPADG